MAHALGNPYTNGFPLKIQAVHIGQSLSRKPEQSGPLAKGAEGREMHRAFIARPDQPQRIPIVLDAHITFKNEKEWHLWYGSLEFRSPSSWRELRWGQRNWGWKGPSPEPHR